MSRPLFLSLNVPMQSLWYWGPINAAVAETILEKEKDGTFLVRDSTDDRFLFSLSCKYDGKVGHIRIEHNGGHFMFRKIDSYKSDNIRDFVEKAIENSHSVISTFFVSLIDRLIGFISFHKIWAEKHVNASLFWL